MSVDEEEGRLIERGEIVQFTIAPSMEVRRSSPPASVALISGRNFHILEGCEDIRRLVVGISGSANQRGEEAAVVDVDSGQIVGELFPFPTRVSCEQGLAVTGKEGKADELRFIRLEQGVSVDVALHAPAGERVVQSWAQLVNPPVVVATSESGASFVGTWDGRSTDIQLRASPEPTGRVSVSLYAEAPRFYLQGDSPSNVHSVDGCVLFGIDDENNVYCALRAPRASIHFRPLGGSLFGAEPGMTSLFVGTPEHSEELVLEGCSRYRVLASTPESSAVFVLCMDNDAGQDGPNYIWWTPQKERRFALAMDPDFGQPNWGGASHTRDAVASWVSFGPERAVRHWVDMERGVILESPPLVRLPGMKYTRQTLVLGADATLYLMDFDDATLTPIDDFSDCPGELWMAQKKGNRFIVQCLEQLNRQRFSFRHRWSEVLDLGESGQRIRLPQAATTFFEDGTVFLAPGAHVGASGYPTSRTLRVIRP